MIAMAIAGQPKVLIADEPTTALDVTVQAQILELIRDLQKETGTAVILITHDMGVVAEMADRVIVMNGGRMVEAGPVARDLPRPARRLHADAARRRAAARLGAGRPPEPRGAEGRPGGRGARPHRRLRHPRRAAPPPGRAASTRSRASPSTCAAARRWRWSANPAAASRPPAARSCNLVALRGRRRHRRPGRPRASAGDAMKPVRRDDPDDLPGPLRLARPAHDGGRPGRRAAGRSTASPRGSELRDRVAALFTPRRPVAGPDAAATRTNSPAASASASASPARCRCRRRSSSPTRASRRSTSRCRRRCSTLLQELQAELGLSYLFISHDMAVVERISHRIAVMYLGQIVEMGDRDAGAPRPAPSAIRAGCSTRCWSPTRRGGAAPSPSPRAKCRARSARSAPRPSGSRSATSAPGTWWRPEPGARTMPKTANMVVLSAADNVGIALADIAGPWPAQRRSTAARSRPARRSRSATRWRSGRSRPGEEIVRFGVPVGIATLSIDAGRLVHVHNVRSRYFDNDENHYE